MSDTPRTDVAQHNMGSIMEPHYVVDADFSRYLERELAAAIASFSEECERAQREGARVIKLQVELAEAQAKISAMRRWVNNNMTFYDVEPDGPDVCTSVPNIPTLCAVSKRIWYHATDNQTVSLFSEVIDLR